MKAAVCIGYGPPEVVVRVQDIEKPFPKDDEVLVKVRASSLNPADWHMKKGKPAIVRLITGLRTPKNARIGFDLSGVVEAIGRNVTRFDVGDEVFGMCHPAIAEYACAPESGLARKPANVSFEESAAVPLTAYTALQGLRDRAKLAAGQHVLINGAAGGVGTMAVQIAKWLGAEVTAVCSTGNMSMIRSLGADRVIDYTQEDFTKNGQAYDVIFDLVANHSLRATRRVIKPHGFYIAAGILGLKPMMRILPRMLAMPLLSRFTRQKWMMLLAKGNAADLATISELVESGKIRPVIDKISSMAELPNAINHLDAKHTRGKVVISI
jgi:NADPH:quinone reductase-like Zn-dependent oxidoreductase